MKNYARTTAVIRKKWAWISFIALGIASTIWFLVRVIPKPSRATYPCIRAAAPFMSSFLIWIIGISASSLLFRRSLRFIRTARVPLALVLLTGSFLILSVTSFSWKQEAGAAPFVAQDEDYPANEPYGEARGIYPGRVVWYWNPASVNQLSNMSVNGDGIVDEKDDVYYLRKNNREAEVDMMMDAMMLNLTGAASLSEAWDSVFRYHNRTVNQRETGYADGETIYIKTNNQGIGLSHMMNADLSQRDSKVWNNFPIHMTATSPYSILATLKHLVNEAGVPEENIYVGDPHNNFNNIYYDIIREQFAGVHIIGVNSHEVEDCEAYGRTLSIKETQDRMFYSEKGTMIDGGSDKFYTRLMGAEYIINIAAMKSHIRGGITLFAKSHFGSHTRSSAAHLHPGLVAPDKDLPMNAGYGKYRVLTDILGHEELGGKRMLSILDGLWGGPPHELHAPRRWDMQPFNGTWTASLFASLDPVAIASVAHDFLRTEYSVADWGEEAYPNILGVDDYLHQAADAQFWPEDIVYDPENDGTPLGSLGTHEHWNNATEMKYSRNLDPGGGTGIELVQLHATTSVTPVWFAAGDLLVYPNPATGPLTVELDHPWKGDVRARIFDVSGRLVLEDHFRKDGDIGVFSLDLSALKGGNYTLSLDMGQDQMSRSLLVVR
jgi:hypothetical protein